MAILRRMHNWLIGPDSDVFYVLFWVLMTGWNIGLHRYYVAVLTAYIALLLWVDHLGKQAKVDAFHRGIVVGQRSVMTARGRWPTPDEAAKGK